MLAKKKAARKSKLQAYNTAQSARREGGTLKFTIGNYSRHVEKGIFSEVIFQRTCESRMSARNSIQLQGTDP